MVRRRSYVASHFVGGSLCRTWRKPPGLLLRLLRGGRTQQACRRTDWQPPNTPAPAAVGRWAHGNSFRWRASTWPTPAIEQVNRGLQQEVGFCASRARGHRSTPARIPQAGGRDWSSRDCRRALGAYGLPRVATGSLGRKGQYGGNLARLGAPPRRNSLPNERSAWRGLSERSSISQAGWSNTWLVFARPYPSA